MVDTLDRNRGLIHCQVQCSRIPIQPNISTIKMNEFLNNVGIVGTGNRGCISHLTYSLLGGTEHSGIRIFFNSHLPLFWLWLFPFSSRREGRLAACAGPKGAVNHSFTESFPSVKHRRWGGDPSSSRTKSEDEADSVLAAWGGIPRSLEFRNMYDFRHPGRRAFRPPGQRIGRSQIPGSQGAQRTGAGKARR